MAKKVVGRLGIEDIANIQKLLTAGFDAKEIAKQLNRSEKTILEAIHRTRDDTKENMKEDLVSSLRRKHYWPQIKASLKDEAEIDYFEREWASLMSQLLTQDILHTDEIMVRDLILQDIDCFRITSASADVHRRKEQLDRMVNEELMKDREIQDLTQIRLWRDEIVAYTASLTALTRQYADSQSRKDLLFKSLKTTRDQRYREIKENNKDIFSLIVTLDQIENREKEGRYAALINLAAHKVEQDWAEPHEFGDGSVDRLILSADTIEKYNKEEEHIDGGNE